MAAPVPTAPQLAALRYAAMTPRERMDADLDLPRRDVRQRCSAHGWVTWEVQTELYRGVTGQAWSYHYHVVNYKITEAGQAVLDAATTPIGV